MQVRDANHDHSWYQIPGLAEVAIVYYGPARPSGGDPRFTVTAAVCINGRDYRGSAHAESLDDDVEPLVEQAKAALHERVAPVIERGTEVYVINPGESGW